MVVLCVNLLLLFACFPASFGNFFTTMLSSVSGPRFPFAAAVALAHAAAQDASFRLARAYSSGLVLQAEFPSLSGFGVAGANITVTTTDGETASGTVDAHSLEWVVDLAPRPASAPKDSAAIGMTVSSPGLPNITLSDVLFGDVWVCSGV